jgi:methylmalonyl-CoA/ethylmalonyl-CoA epimerase
MTETAEFGLSSIGQIAIATHDVERALAFYRDTLGMRFLFRAPVDLAFLDCGGVRIMLARPDAPEFDHRASTLYYKVPDIGAAHETLRARGVRFRDEPHKVADLGTHELWLAFFEDVDGNVLSLMSEVAKA